MTTEATQDVRISQDFAIALPKGGDALPIPMSDWTRLKDSVQAIDRDTFSFKDVGLVLLGAALSTFITIQTGAFSAASAKDYLHIAWSAVLVTGLVGACCLFFEFKVRKIVKSQAADVSRQMTEIEQRYEIH